MMKSKNNKKRILKGSFFILLLFLCSCDFSSRLNKDILEIQENVKNYEFEKAVRQYEHVLTRNPPKEIRLKIYFQIGEIYLLYLNKPKIAKKYYRLILNEAENPKWLIQAQEKLGDINFSFVKDFQKAGEIYETLSEFRPQLAKHDFYEYRLALSQMNAGDYNKSKAILEKIVASKNHTFIIRSYYFLGMQYFETKNWTKAIEYWKEYLKREQKQNYIVETKFLIANAYETMEKLKEAYDIYYSLLGEYPNPDVIKNRLKSIYARRVSRKR